MPDVLSHYYLPKMKFKYTLGGVEEDIIDIYNIFKRRLPEDQRSKFEEKESEIINAILKEKAKRSSSGITQFVIDNPWVGWIGGAFFLYFLFVKRR